MAEVWRRSAGDGVGSASTPTTTPAAAWPTRSPAVQAGRDPGAGDGERLRRAVRQRQPDLDHPQPAAQARLRVPDREPARVAHRRRRTTSPSCSTSPPTPTRPTWAATRSPTRAACTSPGSAPIRPRSSTSSPRSSATAARCSISELSGKGTVQARAREAGIELDDAAAASVRRAGQGARAPRLPLRGRRRLLRAAAAQGDRRVRAAVHARVLAGDRREARRRPRRDRGHDQDLGRDGERYVRTAEGNGPVNALDRALREALGRDLPAPGATSSWSTSRSGSSTRPRAPARSPGCCSTPPTASSVWGSIGVSENVIEASWEALVDSLEYGMQPSRGAASRRADAAARQLDRRSRPTDPARAAGARRPMRRSACSTCCAPGQLSLGPLVPEFERAFAARWAPPTRCAVSSGTAGPAPGAARGRRDRRRRGRHQPVLVRGQRQRRSCLSGRGRCSPTSTR